ncbi:MAG: hypothetical protein RR332_04325, partial [Clostridiales bacterium]
RHKIHLPRQMLAVIVINCDDEIRKIYRKRSELSELLRKYRKFKLGTREFQKIVEIKILVIYL